MNKVDSDCHVPVIKFMKKSEKFHATDSSFFNNDDLIEYPNLKRVDNSELIKDLERLSLQNSVPEIRYPDQSEMVESEGSVSASRCDSLTIPIDDNEWAIIDPDSQTNLAYNILYSENKRKSHTKSSSFHSYDLLKPVDTKRNRRNSAEYVSNRSFSPGNKGRPDSISYDSGSDHGNTDKSDKEKGIFESNGLFIKNDHPLFMQRFSRKVFVGGLPRDISINGIKKRFSNYGELHVDWPNREAEVVPPNGFAFLHFDQISGVEKLHEALENSKVKNKLTISSATIRNKEIEIKFWRMADCEHMMKDANLINPHYTVFVGALPRTTTAFELAYFMEETFDNVDYAAIDVDMTYGYPKGAGRVTFGNKTSFAKALDSHYIDMDFGNIGKKKRIEIKPFLLNDQKCDICASDNINRSADKYCSRCESFICEDCKFNRLCINDKPHNLIGRSTPDPSFNYEY